MKTTRLILPLMLISFLSFDCSNPTEENKDPDFNSTFQGTYSIQDGTVVSSDTSPSAIGTDSTVIEISGNHFVMNYHFWTTANKEFKFTHSGTYVVFDLTYHKFTNPMVYDHWNGKITFTESSGKAIEGDFTLVDPRYHYNNLTMHYSISLPGSYILNINQWRKK